MTIYIGNLSFDAEIEDIVGFFSSYGEVKDCKIPLDRETGRKRGFAFVDMANQEDEQKKVDEEFDEGEEEDVRVLPTGLSDEIPVSKSISY